MTPQRQSWFDLMGATGLGELGFGEAGDGIERIG